MNAMVESNPKLGSHFPPNDSYTNPAGNDTLTSRAGTRSKVNIKNKTNTYLTKKVTKNTMKHKFAPPKILLLKNLLLPKF